MNAHLGAVLSSSLSPTDHHHNDGGPVASLGWVSPGAATEGVTPIFAEKKTGDLFLVITVCQFCSVTPISFPAKK